MHSTNPNPSDNQVPTRGQYVRTWSVPPTARIYGPQLGAKHTARFDLQSRGFAFTDAAMQRIEGIDVENSNVML